MSASAVYNPAMPKPPHPGRKGGKLSLAPLTPDQALSGLLRVKPADLKRAETAESADAQRPAAKRQKK